MHWWPSNSAISTWGAAAPEVLSVADTVPALKWVLGHELPEQRVHGADAQPRWDLEHTGFVHVLV